MPGIWGPLALALLAGAWWQRRPIRRELGLVGIPLAIGALLLGLGVAHEKLARPDRAQLEAHAQEQWSRLWEELEASADQAIANLPATLESKIDREQAFSVLHRISATAHRHPDTLLILDRNGEPAAWAGPGLLHDLSADLTASGRSHRVGFSAITLLVMHPLTTGDRPWKLVAGHSYAADHLPFDPAPWWTVAPIHWSVVDGSPVEREARLSVESPATPTLLMESPLASRASWRSSARRLGQRLAWALIGLALISFAITRTVRTVSAGRRPQPVPLSVIGAASACSWAMAMNMEPSVALTLALSTAVAAGGLLLPARGRSSPWAAAAWSGAAVLAAILLPRLPFWPGTPALDLGSRLLASPDIVAARLALFGIVFGLLGAARGELRTSLSGLWAVAGFSFLLLAAATHDFPLVALAAIAIGGAAVGAWSAAAPRRMQAATLALLAIGAALIAATGWETGYREVVKRQLRTVLLPAMAPPDKSETVQLAAELNQFFEQVRLEEVFSGETAAADTQDLAYALWRRSPLARHGILSALVVTPAESPSSGFSFGLPPIRDGLADWSPDQLRSLTLSGWPQQLLQGEGRLHHGGGPWATIRYWLLLRPGFRLQTPTGGDLAVDLLRGDPVSRPPAEAALKPARYALYDAAGRPLIVPWAEAPWLPLDSAATNPAIPTPGGLSWTFRRQAADGIEVAFLPLLAPAAALIRVGNHLVAVTAAVTLLLFVALLLALPRAAVREVLGRTLRSYSKRLMIVFTGLVMVPLLLLNIVLLREFESRLESQNQAAGEAALDTAQRVLGDYLSTLPTGFGIDTAVDDDLLLWLSRVAGHEVNLYWGGNIYASSRQDLFTAGILPERIPGEVYSRLSLQKYRLSTRVNRAGETAYLEIYAPLRIPGAAAQARLILSMPLLAQQEEVAAEIARLRNAGMVVTSVLFILLVGVGTHLAQRFTRPLQELVAGTQRITAGATSLDLSPPDLELSALVEAVDTMARRIAEGRASLLLEKEIVERVVDNITSGVVSLNAAGIVLMHNRIAADLLGVEDGSTLLVALGANPELDRVAAFVAGVSGEVTESTTVHLGAPGQVEKEWSLIWVPLPRAGDPGALLVVEDITEVLRSQRLQAWAEMARIIAHEVKNPLTPIQLSTEHMREVWRRHPEDFEPILDSCTSNILQQVDTLREIAGEFSIYSHVPRFEPRPDDLVTRLRDIVRAYESAASQGIQVTFESDRVELSVYIDARLLDRAMRNLMENAIRVTSAPGEVVIHLSSDGDEAIISITDTGPGVATEALPRIFDPYFSTHAGGTGLGLPIARRVVEEHGGTIAARNRRRGGLEVLVRLPLGDSRS